MTYGTRLEAALVFAKKTRKQLADELGCKPQTIGIVITWADENDRKLSTIHHIHAAKFLKVNAHWLATGEGEMQSDAPQVTKEDGHYVIRGSPGGSREDWPFELVERNQYLALPLDSQAIVQKQFQEAIYKEITRLYLKQEAPEKASRAA